MSAAQVLNNQLHIDTFGAFFGREYLKDELFARKISRKAGIQWGYCLQHRHFDLAEGEIMLFTFRENMITCKVEMIDNLSGSTYPCMYYSFNGQFHPVGVCRTKEHALCDIPDHSVALDGIGICSASFNGYVEYTNVEKRTQVLVPVSHQKSTEDLIITMVFDAEDGSYCSSFTYCSVGIDMNGKEHHSRTWGHAFIPE